MKDSKAKVERFCPYRKRPKIVLNSGDVCESTLETEKLSSDDWNLLVTETLTSIQTIPNAERVYWDLTNNEHNCCYFKNPSKLTNSVSKCNWHNMIMTTTCQHSQDSVTVVRVDQPSLDNDTMVTRDQPSPGNDTMVTGAQPSPDNDTMVAGDQLSLDNDTMVTRDQPSSDNVTRVTRDHHPLHNVTLVTSPPNDDMSDVLEELEDLWTALQKYHQSNVQIQHRGYQPDSYQGSLILHEE